METIINRVNHILSRMWLGDSRFLHAVSDFFYEAACLAYKLSLRFQGGWTAEARQTIDATCPEYSEAQKKECVRLINRNWLRYGLDPEVSLAIKRNHPTADRRSFVSATDRLKYSNIMNERQCRKLFNHKYECWKKYQEFYKRDLIRAKDWEQNLVFFERHPMFFYKPENMSQGVGAQVVRVDDFESIEEMMRSLPDTEHGLCEEFIVQHPALADFHAASVNTIRIATVIGRDGRTRFYDPVLRCGVGDSCIDNACSGGLCANVDMKTGRILTDGVTRNGTRFACHPDSGIRFQGYQIPEWESLREQLLKQAAVLPGVRYIGWDMALTADNGWVVVEANYFAQHTCQHADGTGRKKKFLGLMYGREPGEGSF